MAFADILAGFADAGRQHHQTVLSMAYKQRDQLADAYAKLMQDDSYPEAARTQFANAYQDLITTDPFKLDKTIKKYKDMTITVQPPTPAPMHIPASTPSQEGEVQVNARDIPLPAPAPRMQSIFSPWTSEELGTRKLNADLAARRAQGAIDVETERAKAKARAEIEAEQRPQDFYWAQRTAMIPTPPKPVVMAKVPLELQERAGATELPEETLKALIELVKLEKAPRPPTVNADTLRTMRLNADIAQRFGIPRDQDVVFVNDPDSPDYGKRFVDMQGGRLEVTGQITPVPPSPPASVTVNAQTDKALDAIPPQFQGALDIVLGNVSGDARKRNIISSISRAAERGDTVTMQKVLVDNLLSSEGAAIKQGVVGRIEAVPVLARLSQDLKALPTGLASGTVEEVANKLGRTNDPKLVAIRSRIQDAIAIYRRAMTGAAFSESEGAMYAKMSPDIKNLGVLNVALLDGLTQSFSEHNAAFWDRKIGSANAQALGVLGGGAPTPPPGNGGWRIIEVK